MDDNTNNIPQETPEDAAKSIGDEWQQIPSASAEEWSKDIPATPVPPEVPVEADRWGAPQPAATEDPNRWAGELYTPGAEAPQAVPPERPAESVVVDVPPVGATAQAAAPEKKSFPVWAIILIVIFVLMLCCVCPIAIILGIFSSNWQQFSALLLAFI